MKKCTSSILALLRISMAWIFLWPFLDKVFGLGFSTEPAKSWLLGTSPTTGFLSFGTQGPFVEFYKMLAGQVWVDWLFMLGLLLIGLALFLGVGLRIASYTGTLLLVLLWLAAFPPLHNPFLDEHLIYALVLLLLGHVDAGQSMGLGKQWARTSIVKKFPILK